MALIPYAAPATEQPQGATPEIDWANPLNEGAGFSAPLSDGFSDIVGGTRSGTINGTVLEAPTAEGRGAQFDGSSYLDYGSGDLISSTSPFTITLYEETDTTGSYNSLFAFSAGTTRFVMYRGTAAGYTCVIGPLNGGATVREFSSLGAQTNGEKKRFVITGTGGLGSVTGLRLWADGVEQTSGTSNLSAAGGNNTIGWGGANNKFNGKLSDVNLYARVWTDEEIARYFECPGQVYRGDSVLVPISVGGGGTPTLTVHDSAHAHALDSVVLTSSATLAVQDMAHGHALDAPTLSTGTALAVADAQHAHALDNVTLSTTGATSLTVADLLHAHTLDAVVLTSDAYLAVADMLHAHALDNVGLTSDAYLAAADLAHAHALDAVVLGTEVALAVADALHAHALDGVTLTLGDIDLVIAGVMHAHALDTLALTLDTYLAIADALHAHALDNADLSLDTYLVVADALHAHAIDNLTLSFPATGALSDAEFRQMYDWLYALSQKQLLTVGTFLALK